MGNNVGDSMTAATVNLTYNITEINGNQINNTDLIIANPNCSTIQLLAALYPLHKAYNIKRMVFPSSQSVYGTTSKLFNNQPVKEDDYCGLQHQLFTYAVMKLLNEFMAKKYIDLHGISIACTRPSVVFGYGRKRSSLMWAEEFATNPALEKPVHLPFPESNKDNYIYVEDCAEQFIELSLKEKLNHFVYNTGSETVSGTELKKIITELMPNAEVSFNETGKPTPFIDDQNDQRIREELSFVPKSLKEGIKAHMNEARIANNLNPI